MNTKQWVILIVVAVVFAGGGFFGGMKYQQSKTPVRAAGAAGFAARRTGTGAAAGSFVSGQVLSVDSNTITVKLQNGGSQNVILAPSTQYGKMVAGTSADVVVGTSVIATGSTNSDGSVTAQNVQIRTASSTPTGFPRASAAPGQ
jgi:hypothetical protein